MIAHASQVEPEEQEQKSRLTQSRAWDLAYQELAEQELLNDRSPRSRLDHGLSRLKGAVGTHPELALTAALTLGASLGWLIKRQLFD